MPYNAFISYSHAADNQLAPKLQRALQQFAKPFYQLRALNIFRDQTSLVSTPELWPTIQKALHASEYFILLASKDAAQSVWVQKEVQEWLDTHNGSVKQMLIVLTNDTIVWDNAANDFDWTQTDAIPHNLKGKFENEPLFVDLKWARTENEVTLKSPNFADAVATLAAPLHGVPKEQIYGEENKQHRKFRQVAAVVIVLLAGLLIASTYEYFEASRQRHEAQNQLTNNFWSSANQAFINNKPLEYLYLMGKAIESSHDENKTKSLVTEVQPHLPDYSLQRYFGSNINGALFNKKASLVLAWSKEDSIFIYESSGRQLISMQHTGQIFGAVFNSDESQILSWGNQEVNLWNASTGKRIAGPFKNKSSSDSNSFKHYGAAFSQDEQSILYWGFYEIQVQPIGQANPLTLSTYGFLENLLDRSDFDVQINSVVYNKESSNILSCCNRSIILWDAHTGKRLWTIPTDDNINGASFNQDESKVLYWGNDCGAVLVDAATGKQIHDPYSTRSEYTKLRVLGFTKSLHAVFNQDESFILTSSSDGVIMWQVKDGHKLIGPLVYNDSEGEDWITHYGAVFNKDQKNILSWGPDGIRILDSRFGRKILGPLKHRDEIVETCYNKEETEILSWSGYEARVWDKKTSVPITVIRHERPIMGASWSSDGRYLLSYSNDGIKIWERVKMTIWYKGLELDKKIDLMPTGKDSLSGFQVDLDFPQELFILQSQALTGTALSDTIQNAYALPKAQWEKINAEYQKLAEEHFQHCQYPEANYWHRTHKK